MVKSGDTIESSSTGERIVFRRTADETDGVLLEFDMFAARGAHPGAPHAHLRHTETIDVREGRIRFTVDGKERVLEAAAVLHRHRDEYRVAVVPPLIQRTAFPLLAGAAWLLGRPTVVEFPKPDVASAA